MAYYIGVPVFDSIFANIADSIRVVFSKKCVDAKDENELSIYPHIS